jgi:hypothetical protein
MGGWERRSVGERGRETDRGRVSEREREITRRPQDPQHRRHDQRPPPRPRVMSSFSPPVHLPNSPFPLPSPSSPNRLTLFPLSLSTLACAGAHTPQESASSTAAENVNGSEQVQCKWLRTMSVLSTAASSMLSIADVRVVNGSVERAYINLFENAPIGGGMAKVPYTCSRSGEFE